ncbi:hypothetical protein BGX38DRAFT_1281443 [Terfezia claveryi]|nr:hypothetical protein BGX38DRAFT_1281443 [Terfezia claveryi]
MPEITARKLNLTLIPNNDVMIRTATNEVRAVEHCVYFDLDIAGVVANIKVYVIDIPQSYTLLLGRRWLYQVRALRDYSNHTYIIYDAEGKLHKVSAIGDQKIEKLSEVILNPNKYQPYTDLTNQERDEILLGKDKMRTIIAKLVFEAMQQSKEMAVMEEEWDSDDNHSSLESEDMWNPIESCIFSFPKISGNEDQQ